jgi:hypothetical protein
MYCSGCGAAVAADLNYCKQCGHRIAAGDTDKSAAQSMAESLGYVGGFGLAGFFVGAFLLTKAGVESWALIWISLFYLAALFGICLMMLRQTSPFSRNRSGQIKQAARMQSHASTGLDTSQLPPATTQPASVVEHTTRTLHEVERK